MIERTPRQLAGLGFLVLAGLLAWGGTVDPAKASLRWIFVAVLGCFWDSLAALEAGVGSDRARVRQDDHAGGRDQFRGVVGPGERE